MERHLAHGSDEELGDAYDRTQFFEQRRIMVQDWADYLERLASRRLPDVADDVPEPLLSASDVSSDEVIDNHFFI